MNHLPFVIGAYAVTIVATLALAWSSYAAMRSAETEADRIGRER